MIRGEGEKIERRERELEHRGGSKWRILTGNDLGIALGWWCFYMWRAHNPHADAGQLHMLGSTVSTHFIAALARHEGFHYEVLPSPLHLHVHLVHYCSVQFTAYR